MELRPSAAYPLPRCGRARAVPAGGRDGDGRTMCSIGYAAFLFHGSTLDHLLSSYGYAAVFAFIAIESLGVPFPGETMLITAGLYAGRKDRATARPRSKPL